MKEILHLMSWPMMAVGILVSVPHWLPLWIDAVLRSHSSENLFAAVADDRRNVAAGAGVLAVDKDNNRYMACQASVEKALLRYNAESDEVIPAVAFNQMYPFP